MRKTSIKTIIALALSSSAIAAEPFNFEGTWYFDRYNPINDGTLLVRNCKYLNCDVNLSTFWGNKKCSYNGKMELITNEKAQIIKENSINSHGTCQINIIHSGNGQITITSKNCETLCDKDASFDGKYENAALPLAYPTGYDCRDERITYAEAAICQNKTLSLAEKESQKIREHAPFSEAQINHWLYQRNLCKTDVNCLKKEYENIIWAGLKFLRGKQATLYDYYQLTQTSYGSPLDSFLIRKNLEEKLPSPHFQKLEKDIGLRFDKSSSDRFFLTFAPYGFKEETVCFYLQKNYLWLGMIAKGENGLNEIFLYTTQGETKNNIPQEVQKWQNTLGKINCPSIRNCQPQTDIKLNCLPIL